MIVVSVVVLSTMGTAMWTAILVFFVFIFEWIMGVILLSVFSMMVVLIIVMVLFPLRGSISCVIE